MSTITYYHGGAPRIKTILPPAITKLPTTADYGAEGVCRRDKVYITTNLDAAIFFAALYYSGDGQVHVVRPVGTLEKDPDFNAEPCESFQCDKAIVVRSIKLKYKLMKKIRDSALKDLPK